MGFKELYSKGRKNQDLNLDEEMMWTAIEQHLEQPKKKRRFLWIWFGAGLLVLALMAHLLLDTSLSNSDKRVESTTTTKTLPHDLKQAKPIDQVNEDALRASPSNSEYPMPKPTDSRPETLHYNGKGQVGRSSKDLESSTNLRTDAKKTTAPQTSYASNAPISNSWSNMTTDSAGQRIAQSSPTTESMTAPTPLSATNEPAVAVQGAQEEATSQQALRSAENATPLTTRLSSVYLLKQTIEIAGPQLSPSHPKPMLCLSLSTNYLSHSNSLEALAPSVQPWVDLHEESNTPRLSGSVGTMLTYVHPSGFGLGLGLKVRRVAEWYKATIIKSTPIQIASDSAEYVFINGVQSFNSGFLTGVRIDQSRYQTPINRVYFDIPIAISYQRSWSKVHCGVSMAYNFNVSHSYYGRSYVEDLAFLDRSQLLERGTYKRSGVHSLSTSIWVERDLTDRWSIALSASHWNQLTSSMRAATRVRERYRGLGLGLSVKRKFVLR